MRFIFIHFLIFFIGNPINSLPILLKMKVFPRCAVVVTQRNVEKNWGDLFHLIGF